MSACPKLSELCRLRRRRAAMPMEETWLCHPRTVKENHPAPYRGGMTAVSWIGNRSVNIRECETTALYLLENGLGFLIYAEGMCACGEGSHRSVVAVCR